MATQHAWKQYGNAGHYSIPARFTQRSIRVLRLFFARPARLWCNLGAGRPVQWHQPASPPAGRNRDRTDAFRRRPARGRARKRARLHAASLARFV